MCREPLLCGNHYVNLIFRQDKRGDKIFSLKLSASTKYIYIYKQRISRISDSPGKASLEEDPFGSPKDRKRKIRRIKTKFEVFVMGSEPVTQCVFAIILRRTNLHLGWPAEVYIASKSSFGSPGIGLGDPESELDQIFKRQVSLF